jgi:hypothetical protein
MAVGLEGVVARRADVMQHQDRTDTRANRAKGVMGTGQIQGSQAGPDHAVPNFRHFLGCREVAAGADTSSQRLKKLL